MKKEYRNLLGELIRLVKLADKKPRRSRSGRGTTAETGETDYYRRVAGRLAKIEARVTFFAGQPEAETKYPITRVIRDHNMDEVERRILYYLLGNSLLGKGVNDLNQLATFISCGQPDGLVDILVRYLSPSSKFMRQRILCEELPFHFYTLNTGIYHQVISSLLPAPTEAEIREKQKAEEEEAEAEAADGLTRVPSTNEIYAYLDERVVGQAEAKQALSLAVFRHYRQILAGAERCAPANVLLVGPTGVGKTLLVRTLGEFLKVPVAFVSANEYSETGYVGRSVGDMVGELLRKAGGDKEKAETGIIFIDEIDKLAERTRIFEASSKRDVSGRSVQEELLDLLESDQSRSIQHGHCLNEESEVDTSRIMFIGAGACNGLEAIIQAGRRQRPETDRPRAVVGFLREQTDQPAREEPEPPDLNAALESYGFIPELLGRFPIICSLAPLSEVDLVKILESPGNSLLAEYRDLFRSLDLELEFEKEAVRMIARAANAMGTGARALRSAIEVVLRPYFFAAGQAGSSNQPATKHLVINKAAVKARAGNETSPEKQEAEAAA